MRGPGWGRPGPKSRVRGSGGRRRARRRTRPSPLRRELVAVVEAGSRLSASRGRLGAVRQLVVEREAPGEDERGDAGRDDRLAHPADPSGPLVQASHRDHACRLRGRHAGISSASPASAARGDAGSRSTTVPSSSRIKPPCGKPVGRRVGAGQHRAFGAHLGLLGGRRKRGGLDDAAEAGLAGRGVDQVVGVLAVAVRSSFACRCRSSRPRRRRAKPSPGGRRSHRRDRRSGPRGARGRFRRPAGPPRIRRRRWDVRPASGRPDRRPSPWPRRRCRSPAPGDG